ncbi:MAG: hypothetical protein ACP5LD_00105 [Desulfomonilaceae bacterium]
MEVKKMLCCAAVCICMSFASWADAADSNNIYLNAFIETSSAYLNDAFLLMGAVSDAVMTEHLSAEAAAETIANVQKRLRIVRAKINAAQLTRVRLSEKKLLSLLDRSYACLDQQAWALLAFLKDHTPASAKRFEGQRTECLERIQRVSAFYAGLPPAPELPEPLSTR